MTDKTDSDDELLELCLHDLRAAREVANGALP